MKLLKVVLIFFLLTGFAFAQDDNILKEEADTINYIIGHITDYIESKDWSNWDKRENRAKEIGDILTTYGYGEDLHYCQIKEWSSEEKPHLPSIYEINCWISFKSDITKFAFHTWWINNIKPSIPM